jgi:mono/diheme cytochrome c family protein
MIESNKLIFALCLLWGANGLAHAEEKLGEPQGELLYSTHCKACHTEKIHWREQKLAADWPSLKAQVRRWQASIGLGWSEEEITAVAHYMNALHYRFKVTDQKDISQGENPNHVLRKE